MAIVDLRQQGGGGLGQNLLQFFLQKEQLELQKEAQSLREEEFNLEKEQVEAQQQAGMSLLAQQVAQDPTVAQAVGQAQPQTMAPGQQAAPSPLGGQMQVPVPRSQPDVSQLNPATAAQMAQGFQQQRQTEADIQLAQAQTGLVGAQTGQVETETAQAETLFPLMQRIREAEAEMAEAEPGLRQRELNLEATRAQNELRLGAMQLAQREREGIFQAAGELGVNPAEISALSFGSRVPPTMDELTQRTLGRLEAASTVADNEEEFQKELFNQRLTQTTAGLGFSTDQETAFRDLVNENREDPQAALEAAIESDDVSDEDVGRIFVGLQTLFPQTPLRLPEEERVSIIQAFGRFLTGVREAAAAETERQQSVAPTP